MKKVFTLLFILSLFLTLNMNAQLKYGFQLGLNGTSASRSVTSEYDEISFPPKTKLGFNFGLVISYAFNDDMALQSGLLYTNKGYDVDLVQLKKEQDFEGDISGYWRFNYNYLELPLHFVYNINDFKIYAGPYLAYGLSGKAIYDITVKYGSDSENYKATTILKPVTGEVKAEDAYTDGEEEASFFKVFNAFDAGLDFGIGYQYNQFLIRAQYSLGFSNITPNIVTSDTGSLTKASSGSTFNHDDYKYTNKGFSFSITYLFGNE